MDENVTLNRSTSNSTNVNSAINEHFEARNIIVGSLGIFMNSLAFLVVLKTDRVIQARRLLLLSLIASDINFMICLCVYGHDNSTKLSEGEGCIPVVMLIMLSMMVTDVTTLHLSALNVLAMYQPFKYRRFFTLRNSGIAVALTWIVNILLCVWLIGFEFSPGMTCAPVVTIPPNRLAGIALISMASVIGIMTLNLLVIIKVNKRHESYLSKRSHQLGNQQQMQKERNDNNETTRSKSKTIRFLYKFRKKRVQPFPASSPRDQTNEVICISQIDPIENKARPCELVPRANLPTPCPQHRGETSTTSGTETSGEPSPAAQSSTPCPIDNIRIILLLLILTTYSALISIPMSVYLSCIAMRLIEDLENVVATPLGIFISSLTTLRACINPVFYALRFVDWKRLVNKIRRPR